MSIQLRYRDTLCISTYGLTIIDLDTGEVEGILKGYSGAPIFAGETTAFTGPCQSEAFLFSKLPESSPRERRTT